MNDYVIDARFKSFEVYASRPDMTYVLYHLPRSHAAPGEPRFLRVDKETGNWALVKDKTITAEVVATGQFSRLGG
jgi:exopolysaccharide biosynthesis predicted pyruvyltransferase EpsI